MSRIAKHPVPLSPKVKVVINNNLLRVEGPLGHETVSVPTALKLEQSPAGLHVVANNDTKQAVALSGLYRNIIANLVKGVVERFTMKLSLKGVGYKANVKKNWLVLSLGYSHDIIMALPASVQAECEKQTTIILSSTNKQLLCDTVAKIKRLRPVEPYNQKGVKIIFPFEEYTRVKEGKKK